MSKNNRKNEEHIIRGLTDTLANILCEVSDLSISSPATFMKTLNTINEIGDLIMSERHELTDSQYKKIADFSKMVEREGKKILAEIIGDSTPSDFGRSPF